MTFSAPVGGVHILLGTRNSAAERFHTQFVGPPNFRGVLPFLPHQPPRDPTGIDGDSRARAISRRGMGAGAALARGGGAVWGGRAGFRAWALRGGRGWRGACGAAGLP